MKLCLACERQLDDGNWRCSSCGFTPEMGSGYRIFRSEIWKPKDGFDPCHFSGLAKTEESHWWFRSRRELVIWALRRYFFPFKNFLEIGCGTGFILSGIREAFPDPSLSGADLFTEGLAYAAKRLPNTSLFLMNARKIPFEEEFDVIGAFDVLEHVEEDEEVLSQLFKAVKRGGGIIVTVPQHPFLWSDQDRYSFHKRRYTREGLVRKVKKVGFQERRVTSFVSLLLPLMFLVRLGREKKEGEFDVFEEFRTRDSLNQVLLKIMSAEIFMIREGISLPAGGSLLLVAIKA
jgi:SAM-dependent methyltransferase